jgi:hypothetical protein
MSLKGDRYELKTDISYFMNEVATRGGVVVLSTVGSGAAMDQASALVTYAASSSGARPVGVLMGDMVNYDLTRQHINFHRDEVQLGGKVRILQIGFVVTNNIIGTPAVSDNAYLTSSGNVMPINVVNTTASNYSASPNLALRPYVGWFGSAKDEDGYAKLNVDLA